MAKNSNGPELTFLFAADIARFEAGINRIIAQLGKVEASINRASAGFNKLGTSSGVASNDVNRLIASLDRNKKSLDANTEAARRNSDAMAKLQSSFEKGRGAADQSQKSIGGVITGLRGLLAGYVGVDAVMRGGRAFVENAVEVGRFEKVLETASGTQAAYAKNFQFLESVADEFRLNILDLGNSFAKLTVATKGTVLEGKHTEELFRAVTVAGSALQMSNEQVTGTFKAFIDTISKGTVQAEELKGQLGDRLVNALGMTAKAFGVSTQELLKMMKNGEILATDLIPRLSKVIIDDLGDAAKNGAGSLGNNIEYAKGQVALLMAEFGKTTGVIDGLTGIASGIGNISNQARKAMDGPLGQLFKYLSTANSLTLGVLTGDLGRRAANGLADDVRQKKPGYKAPYSRPVDESEAFYSNQLGKEVTAKISTDKASLEQAAEERGKKRLEAAIKANKKFENEYKSWAEEFARKINEIEAQAQRKATEEWQSKTERPGFMTSVGPAFTSSGIKELPTGFGGIDEVLKNLENKVKSHDIEGQINIRLHNNLAEEVNDQIIQFEDQMDNMSKMIGDIVQHFAADAGISIAEALGMAMAGLNADEANKKIGIIFGDLLTNLGKALITYSTVIEGIKTALKSMNGWVALAAGVAAVAAGTALKQTANKQSQSAAQRFWTGGIVDEPTGGVDRVHALLRPNEMVLNERQQNTLFRMLREGPGSMGTRGGINNLAVTVNVVGKSRGMDMLWTQERAAKARSRNGGRK